MARKNKKISDASYGIMLGDRLNFAASEAYKLLRANLMFALPDGEDDCRVVGVTSSVRGEGKSTTTLNLAYSIAEAGQYVLVIEADMRLPTMAKRLGIDGSKGISNLLVGMSKGSEVLQRTSLHPNLYVLPAGEIPPNPSELLGSERMKLTMDVLKRDFGYILLDLPPVTAVSDPLVASTLVDGMVLVVRQNYSSKRSLAETVRQLRFVDAKILGFVMTDSDTGSKGRKKYYKKYYKQYGYGYSYGDSTAQKKGKKNEIEKEREKTSA